MMKKFWIILGALVLQACSAVSIVSQVIDSESAQAQIGQPMFRVECAVIASIDGKFDTLDAADIRSFQASYGQEVDAGDTLPADLNGDHQVNLADLRILGGLYPSCIRNPF